MNGSMEICVSMSFHSPKGNLQTQYINVKAPVKPGRVFLLSEAECFTVLSESLFFKGTIYDLIAYNPRRSTLKRKKSRTHEYELCRHLVSSVWIWDMFVYLQGLELFGRSKNFCLYFRTDPSNVSSYILWPLCGETNSKTGSLQTQTFYLDLRVSDREDFFLTGGNLEQDQAYRVVACADKRYHGRCCGRPVDTLSQTVDKCHKWGGWWWIDGWMAGAKESLTRVSKISTAPLGDPQIIQPVSSCSDLPWAISQEESKFWPGG